MTSYRKLAPLSAQVLAALAASVMDTFPHARAASDEASIGALVARRYTPVPRGLLAGRCRGSLGTAQ